MAYCTNCGAHNTGLFCAICGSARAAPTAPDTASFPAATSLSTRAATEHPNGWAWVASAALASLAFALTVAAMFPPYLSGGTSIAATPGHLAYNLPFIVAAALAAVALAIPVGRRLGTGLLIGTAICSTPTYVRSYDDLHTLTAGPGFVLGQLGFGISVLAAVSACLAGRLWGVLDLRRQRSTILWAAVGAALGGLYVIGDSLNWLERVTHATVDGYRFTASGTSTVTTRCCTLLDRTGWELGAELALLVLAIAVPLLAACWRLRATSLGLIAATGLLLLASPLSALVQIADGYTPAKAGIGATQLQEGGIRVSQHVLPGLWIALGASVSLVIFAALRGLGGQLERSEPHHHRSMARQEL